MNRSEQWRELCAKAASEQDPERLLELVKEINRILDAEEQKHKPQTGREKIQ
jgi:hypothetical protein